MLFYVTGIQSWIIIIKAKGVYSSMGHPVTLRLECLQFHRTPCNSETGVEHIRDPEHVNRLIKSNDVEIQKFGFSGIWEVHGVHLET